MIMISEGKRKGKSGLPFCCSRLNLPEPELNSADQPPVLVWCTCKDKRQMQVHTLRVGGMISTVYEW